MAQLYCFCGMSTHKAFMEEASRLAVKAVKRGHGGPFGAVIVKNGKIVGRGWNQTFRNTDPCAHAEVRAIQKACKKLGTTELAGCTMYTSSEPCPMCMAAIYWSLLDGVYFANTKEQAALAGFDDSKIYRELQLPWTGRAISIAHFPDETAEKAFALWQQQLAKKSRS